MTRAIMFVVTMWLYAGFAFAQEAAYQFTPSPGWSLGPANGLVLYTPAGDTTNNTGLTLFPVLPISPDFEGQFNASRSLVEKGLKLRLVQATAQKRSRSDGGENIAAGGAYDTDSGRLVVLFFARGEKATFGMGMLMIANGEKASTYLGQSAAMIGSLRLTNQASQLAAANVAAKRASPNADRQATAPTPARGNAPTQPNRAKSKYEEAAERVRNAPVYTGMGVGGMRQY
jgi:hypothetical protein